MSKFLVNLTLLQTKALVNAYTWTTLPLYTAVQRPWRQLKIAKSTFNMRVFLDSQGRLVYSRPTQASTHLPAYSCQTFAEVIPTLDRTREVVGIRDILSETAALDAKGQPIRVEGRELKKLQLAPKFRWLTVGQVLDRVDAIARGFKELGVDKGDKVLIYAENSPEWFFTGLALARLNATCVTLFSTLGDSGVVYGINQSDARIVVTSQYLLPKVLSLADQLPNVEHLVYIENPREPISLSKLSSGDDDESKIPISTLRQIEAAGEKAPVCRFENPNPDDIAVIMYTSGTTGDPKGVMISHKQLFTSVHNMLRMDEEYGSLGANTDHTAYLPMAHMFGYVVNMAIFSTKGRLGFCSPFTLLDSSPSHVPGQVGDIKLLKPKYFVAVPLVLERILKEIYHKLNSRSPIAAPLFTYLMDYKIRWTARGYDTPIINRLVCKRINDQFGGELKMIGVSSAPLHARTQALIAAALNVKINLAYGSTENCGPASALHIDDLALGSCGVPYHSFKFFLKDWPEGGYYTTGDRSSSKPRGEIYLGGDSIATGYYKLPVETAQAFVVDPDGSRWFRTGDIGEVAHNMTLKIIDRRKDLQKLANGEFVSLGKIESGLRNSPYVENICVCTDPYSNHVTALVSPNRKAMDELARRLGKETFSFEALCNDPAIASKIHSSLTSTGLAIGMKTKELPVQITLVPEEWTPSNLLTAAFKLKRKAITDFYADKIESMFASAAGEDREKMTARSI